MCDLLEFFFIILQVTDNRLFATEVEENESHLGE